MHSPRRWPTLLSASVLALQMVGAGAVALAHATEAPTAPVTIEAQHDARCVVVHDALRCAVCQIPVAWSAAERRMTLAPPPAQRAPVASGPDHHTIPGDVLLSAPPRAPPTTLS